MLWPLPLPPSLLTLKLVLKYSLATVPCHAGGNNVIQNEKTLRKEALEQYLEGGFKESSVIYQVTNGKNAMPAFGGRLDESDIQNVAAYVVDQANGNKWD